MFSYDLVMPPLHPTGSMLERPVHPSEENMAQDKTMQDNVMFILYVIVLYA